MRTGTSDYTIVHRIARSCPCVSPEWSSSDCGRDFSGAAYRGKQGRGHSSATYAHGSAWGEMVQVGGLEPPTSGSTDRRSNQLSYTCTGSPRPPQKGFSAGA